MKWFAKRQRSSKRAASCVCNDPWCDGDCDYAARQERGKAVLSHLKDGGTVRTDGFTELEFVAETESGAFLKDANAKKGETIKVGGGFFSEREVEADKPRHFTFYDMGTLHVLKDGIPQEAGS